MTPATSGLVNTGLNALRGKKPGGFWGTLQQLKNRPAPGAAPATQPGATAAPAPTNASPPGSPLPVGNGIVPQAPIGGVQAVNTPPAVLKAAPDPMVQVPPAAPGAPPAGAPPEYSPTGLNFGPGHDLQSSVIAPPTGAPDRTAMAKSLLANFDASTADQQRQDYRDVGSYASSLGRLGMGQTAQDVQEVGRKHLTDRATLESKLAYDTSDQAIQDAINSRNELRGERGYQTGQAQTAIDRNVQQAQLEEAIRNGTFNRGLSLANAGAAGNPAYAQLTAAENGDTSGADLTGIMELLKRYGYTSATAGKKAA